MVSPENNDGVAGEAEAIELHHHFSYLGVHIADTRVISVNELAFQFFSIVLIFLRNRRIHRNFSSALMSDSRGALWMVRKGGEGELGRVVKVPVFLRGAEGEVWADKTDGHEKWILSVLGRPKPLDGLGRNSSIGIIFIARVCCFKSGTSRERANLVELLVGEVGLLPGELTPFRAGRIEILDDLVVEMRNTKGLRISLVPMTDVENFSHRFRMIAMFRKKLGHGDGLRHETP